MSVHHKGYYEKSQGLILNPLDALAAKAGRFTHSHPESLPTIVVRRALHTGRRAYPFATYAPVKWDFVCLPGWQPLANSEDTLAENLAEAGYHTGFVTDTMPYFAPGMNFHRGFWQWEYIRGQQQDRWRSPYIIDEELLSLYGDPKRLRQDPHGLIPMYLANKASVHREEETTTAKVFQWATQFLEDNRRGQPFYLLIDCFDPHEAWEAPENYYSLYGDPNYTGKRFVISGYGPADTFGHTDEEIAYFKAQYSGLVTLVDTWLGKFLQKMEELELDRNTVVILMSDHGTNFCDNPRRVIGKPVDAMYPGVMNTPLLIRYPNMSPAVCDALTYHTDITATIYDMAGIQSEQGLDGQSLLPLLNGSGTWTPREYITCRYGHCLCYRDDRSWILTDVEGTPQEIFDLETDPHCQKDIGPQAGRERFERAWARLLKDAGGHFTDYRTLQETDAIGQKPQS